jgi:hypothetical protein
MLTLPGWWLGEFLGIFRMELTTDGALMAHPNPSIFPMAVIEKSETGRRHIGASQTVAKLLGTASYFNFYDLKAVPHLRIPVTGQNFFQCRVTKAVTVSSLK